MSIELDEELARHFPGDTAFDELMACEGEKFRHVKTRRTLKFERGGKNYFIKIHRAIGWREVWKNWLGFKRPVTSARMLSAYLRRRWEPLERVLGPGGA